VNAYQHGIKGDLLSFQGQGKIVLVYGYSFAILLFMEPAFFPDVDLINGIPGEVQVVFDRDGAFIRYDGFTGIPAGNEGNDGLHDVRLISANKRKGRRILVYGRT
jgi:hypothetical protein